MNKIVLDERIKHLWIWEQPEKLRCWLDIMFMADEEGRVETSSHKLAKRWKMPQKTIYRMLNDFQATKLLTIVPTKNGTILSLGCDSQNDSLNYGNYQRVTKERDSPNDSQNDSPKEEKPPHTPLKEENTTTTTNNNAHTHVREGSRPAEMPKSHEQDCKMIASLLNSKSWTERTCMNKRMTVAEFTKRINDFKNWLFNTQHPGHSNVKDLLTHFWMWVDIQKQKEQDAEDRRNNKQKQFLTADDKCRLSAERATRETYARLGIEPPASVLAAMRGDYDGYDEPEHLE